jgi:salicylate hydroxylase
VNTLEVAVAGCGPAGLAAALLLHRDGHRVRLYERFESPGPVGSGLMIQPTGQAVLREMGLLQSAETQGARIARMFGCSVPSGRTVLDVRYEALRGRRFGIGMHRAALFDLLFRAVEAQGIDVETGRTVVSSALAAGGRRCLGFADGTLSPSFDLVVDCLGSASPLREGQGRALAYGALWASLDWSPGAGFDESALEQRYVAATVMAGVLPIGRAPGIARPQTAFFWSLRADRVDRWRAEGLEAWKEQVRGLWPDTESFLAQIDHPDRLTFARYHHRTIARPAASALIHIGDSWHATSPQLGQGANMALLDAWALAQALRGSNDLADALRTAVALRRPHVRLYQAMSALFTPVYQSDSMVLPMLRDWVAGPLSRLWPAPKVLAAMVSGLVGRPLRSLGL